MPHPTSSTMILTPDGDPSAAASLPPYVFRKRNERVDWRKIASVDPDRIARQVDFKTLQDNINNVTFCDIESELVGPLDPNYVKLFKLAQLTIEYLLNSQQYLTGVIGEREVQLERLVKESSDVSVELDKDKKELERLKKECHKRKKLLAQQQQVLFAGGPGSYFKCPKCPKAFINESFLQSHLDRKHPDYRPKDDYEQLQRQLAEMKENYERTRAELEESRKTAAELRRTAQAHEESERNLRKLMEEARAEDKESNRRQMETFRATFMDELKDLNAQFRQTQEALALEREKNIRGGVGNRLFDEDESRQMADMIEKQKMEIDALRRKLHERTGIDQLQLEMSAMRSAHEMQIESLKEELAAAKSGDDKGRAAGGGDRVNTDHKVFEAPPPRVKLAKPEGARAAQNVNRNSHVRPKRVKWDEAAHESKMADMRSRMLNNDNFMEEVRDECLQSVASKLVDFGVQHNNNQAISVEDFSRINKSIAISQDKFSQKNPSFFQIRNILKDRLDHQFRTSVSRRLTPSLRPTEPEVETREIVNRIVSEKPTQRQSHGPGNAANVSPIQNRGVGEGGGGGGGIGTKKSQLRLAEEKAPKEENAEDTLPKGTIPFIAHALPEMTNFGPTATPQKASNRNQLANNRFNRNNNSNNNNSNINTNNNNSNVSKDRDFRHTGDNDEVFTDSNNSDRSKRKSSPEVTTSAKDGDDNADDESDDDDDEDDESEEMETGIETEVSKGPIIDGRKETSNESFRDVEVENKTPEVPPRSVGIRLPDTGNDDIDSVSEYDDDDDDGRQDSTPASLNFGASSSAGQNPASSGQTSASAGQTPASAGPDSTPAVAHSASARPDPGSDSESAGVGKSFVELRDKIEQQLYRRKDVAKPAGGVDVGAGRGGAGVGGSGADETNEDVKAPVPAPRSSRQRKSSSGWEDDDDDEDSFTVSSLEGQSHGRGALKLPASSSFAGVSSTLTSSGDAASTSNWGSGATGYGSSGARFGNGAASGGVKSGDKRSVVDVVDWDSDY